MVQLKDIVYIITGPRKDGKGDYELVCVDKKFMFTSMAVEIAKEAGCKTIVVDKK